MACAGVDFGSKTSVVAIARRGGIDVCTNEVSNRATPCIVSFLGAERHIGESAASIAAQNHRNTVASIQRLLGVALTNPFAVAESSRVTCSLIPHPSSAASAVAVDFTGIEAEGDDPSAKTLFSFEALTAMLLSNLMATASAEYKAPVRDLVISVPLYYTHAQRRAVHHAATIANINILRIMNEHAATALSYGIFRTKELDATPIKVAFVDIGEASTTVSITAFTNTRCEVLSAASDPCLGGRDLDDIIFNKLAEHFKATYKIDVASKPKPSARLRKESEKMKKILSTNAEAMLNIECLMDDKDVKGKITRDELLEIAAPLLDKVRVVCEKAVSEANLAGGEKLTAVELVGGSTRIPAFKNAIAEVFDKLGAPIRTTLNTDECIARGCALMSAMLSPAFKVRDYAVVDKMNVGLEVDKTFTDGSPVETLTVVPKGNPIPCVKVLKFKAPGALTVGLRYSEVSSIPAAAESSQICSFLIDAPVDPEAKVHVKLRVTGGSVVELTSAQLVQEVEEEEDVVIQQEPVKPAPAANGAAPTANGTSDADVPMTDARAFEPLGADKEKTAPDGEEKDAKMDDVGDVFKDAKESLPETFEKPAAGKPTAEKPVAEKPAPDKPAPVLTEKRMVKKKKTTDLKVTPLPAEGCILTDDMVQAATEKEANMKAHDLYVRERSEALNSLEAYVYDLRSRIDEYSGDLKDFSTEDMRKVLRKDLDDNEEWIYSEDAEGASKSLFVKRKDGLMGQARSMLLRKKEFDERPVRIRVLEAAMENYKKVIVPGVEDYAHIGEDEKEKLLKCVEGAAVWLKAEQGKQNGLELNVDPVLTCEALTAKLKEVEKICEPIRSMPKPKPAKVETKEGEKKEGDEIVEGDVKVENGGEKKEAGKAEETAPKTSGDEKANGAEAEVAKESGKEAMKD